MAEVDALLEAAPDLRARALLELLYAAGLRVSEATGLDREDLSLDGGFVRVIGKGDRERLVPVGDVALDWLRRWLDEGRPLLLELLRTTTERGGPLFLGDRGGRLARQQAFADRPHGDPGRRPPRTDQSAHAAALVRDASAGGRSRPEDRSGIARTCEYQYDPALHPPDRRAGPRGLRPRASAGLSGG